MIQSAGQVVPLKLDVDRKDVGPIALKYNVSAIPAVFLLDANGKVVRAIELTMEPAKFAAQIDTAVKKYGMRGASPPMPGKHMKQH